MLELHGVRAVPSVVHGFVVPVGHAELQLPVGQLTSHLHDDVQSTLPHELFVAHCTLYGWLPHETLAHEPPAPHMTLQVPAESQSTLSHAFPVAHVIVHDVAL